MESKPIINRTQWVIAICSAAGLAAMAGVVALSKQAAAPPAPVGGRPSATQVEGASGAQPTPGLVNPASPSACGPLDPDRPPEFTVDIEGGHVKFEPLRQGVQVERDIGFRNTGTGPLCIIQVKTGCGCLKAEMVGEKRRFEPGEGGAIRLRVDTTGRLGVVRKSVTVISNDPSKPTYSFPVEMDVSAGLVVDPRYLQFGTVTLSVPVTRDLLLRAPKSSPPWAVTGIRSGRPVPGQKEIVYTYALHPQEDPDYTMVRISITHPGLEVLGAFSDPIVISTTHPERPEIVVQSQISVVPHVVCRARVISLGYVTAGSPRSPSRARLQGGTPSVVFEVTGVDVLPPEGQDPAPGGPGFTAAFGRDDKGWWVDVQYDGLSRKPGLVEALLVVKTDVAEQPELRVPIRATVQGPR